MELDLFCDCVYIPLGVFYEDERCRERATQDDGLCDDCRKHCGIEKNDRGEDQWGRWSQRESIPGPREVTARVEG